LQGFFQQGSRLPALVGRHQLGLGVERETVQVGAGARGSSWAQIGRAIAGDRITDASDCGSG
jgi:hypothetical protein